MKEVFSIMNYKVMNKYFGVEKENINFLKRVAISIIIYDCMVKLCTLLGVHCI